MSDEPALAAKPADDRKSLCEEYAAGAIMDFDRMRRHFCMPRYTPSGWWECDVFELTKTGYFREYEIKLSVEDFVRDAEKKRAKRPWSYGTLEVWENKHELLAAGHVNGPTEFFFVTPVGLIPQTSLPIWAGLIELHDRGKGHRPSSRWTPQTVVPAPKLHRQKANEKIRDHALGSCYYRFHDLLRCVRDREAPLLEWKDEQPPAPEAEPQLEAIKGEFEHRAT